MLIAGSWAAYWYNGNIYSSEIGRGLDILKLVPSEFISQNEIDAAISVRWSEFNPQAQPEIVWPATFSLARAYLDQLARNDGLGATLREAVTSALAAAAQKSGGARRTALQSLAGTIDRDAGGAKDAPRVRSLAKAVRHLSTE